MRRLLAGWPRLAWFAAGSAGCVAAYAVAGAVLGRGPLPAADDVPLVGLLLVPLLLIAGAFAARAMAGRSVRPLAFAAGTLLPPAVLVGLFVLGPVLADHRHRTSFEAAAWRANEGRGGVWPARLRMVDDLLAREGGLRGLHRTEVERLLGPPDESGSFPEWDASYHLGPERGWFRIDSEWLAIRYGADGTVSEARILRD